MKFNNNMHSIVSQGEICKIMTIFDRPSIQSKIIQINSIFFFNEIHKWKNKLINGVVNTE